MTILENYYNKFNEEKRMDSRHGQVEFITTMKYIHEVIDVIKSENKIDNNADISIMDIGAGCGAYCIPLADEGYSVNAVELVKHNLGRIKAKSDKVIAKQGNALNMKKYQDNSFDVTLLFGPMYHLFSLEDKVKALKEAMRITKTTGIILVAYCMNEYGIIMYGVKERKLLDCANEHRFTDDFKTISNEEHLFDYMRLEDIDKVNEIAGAKRIKIIAADGPANYLRPELKSMTEAEFELFMEYHLASCERMDLMGATAHTVDILKK